MKFYLSLLRHNGKRLPAGDVVQPPRLVMMRVTAINGFRLATATCCVGGSTVGQLWEPLLGRVLDEELTLYGIECRDDAATIQEWLLRPHVRGQI
jgi:hypothetical protein